MSKKTDSQKRYERSHMSSLSISIKKDDAEAINSYIMDNYNNCKKSAFYKACIYYCIDNRIDISAYIKEK